MLLTGFDQDGVTAALDYRTVLTVKSYHMLEESIGPKEVAPLNLRTET